MTDNLKTFLKAIGISDELVTQLTAETPPEDFDLNDSTNSYLALREDLFKTKFGKTMLSQKDVDDKFNIYRNTLKQKINKSLGMGHSRADLDVMELEDFFKKTAEFVDGKITAASKATDDELKAKLTETESKLVTLNEAIQQLEDDKTAEIDKIKGEYDAKLKARDFDVTFGNAFSKIELGVSAEQALVFKDFFKREILTKMGDDYSVDLEGNIKGDNPRGMTNFEQNGFYTKLEQPIEYLVEKHKIGKKSNGAEGGGGSAFTSGGTIVTDNLSDNARKMLERAKASQR